MHGDNKSHSHSIDTMHVVVVVAAVLMTTTVASLASAGVVHDVEYSVDDANKRIAISRVGGEPVKVVTFEAHGKSGDHESYDMLHHYPGAATDCDFAPVDARDVLHVLLNDGTMARVVADRVYANFHTHRGRFVYGQLRAFVLDNFVLANKIYAGAPIFRNGILISVVTCQMDDYDAELVVFPVTGPRSAGLVSGQLNFDDRVTVNELRDRLSVYGRKQLPYATSAAGALNVKRFAIASYNNRRAYRDLPRAVFVYHNKKDIILSLVEGEFEIDRLRFDGPLMTK